MKILTKGEKLSDFPTKIIKVVLTGNQNIDKCIKEAVKNIWVISPFEFCSEEDFNQLKSDSDYYFMKVAKMKHWFEKTPKILMLDIVKGGTGDNIYNMLEVVKFPICASDSVSYRLNTFLPAIVDIMQNYINKSLYGSFGSINPIPIKKASKKLIFIAKGDLSPKLTTPIMHKYLKKNIIVTDNNNADKIFFDRADALVSYTIAPAHPVKGSVCYKMLFDGKTHQLYYFKKKRINPRRGAGFLRCDIIWISFSR